MNKVDEKKHETAEQMLADVGAKIDQLIEAAVKAKTQLVKKEEMAVRHSQFAFKELKDGLESAWAELAKVWKEEESLPKVEQTSEPRKIEEDNFPGTC
jgi:hypothetical protein